jgi:hypothetical protein
MASFRRVGSAGPEAAGAGPGATHQDAVERARGQAGLLRPCAPQTASFRKSAPDRNGIAGEQGSIGVKVTATADSADDTDSVAHRPVVAEPIATGAQFDRMLRTAPERASQWARIPESPLDPGRNAVFIRVYQRSSAANLRFP